MLKRTQKEFETIIINLFGRDFLCEKTHYVNNATKVTLCCPKHGLFERIPTDLTKGKGCQKCSYDKLSKERSKWTKETAINESKKYSSRISFKNGSYSAYKFSLKNGLLDEMEWLLPKDLWNKSNYVYAYVDEKAKVSYVGLTCNKVERHLAHQYDVKSSVYKYFHKLGRDIPLPIYLENNLSKVNAQIKEDEWKNYFVNNGYKILNVGKTGKGIGSIGGAVKKWSKHKVFEESKKYASRTEFKHGCRGAYTVALKNGWLNDMEWLIPKFLSIKKITKENVFLEAKKYEYKSHFRENASTCFKLAEKNNWIKEMTWFKVPFKWTKNECLKVSKQYKSLKEFEENCHSCYAYALKQGFLNEMTWLKRCFRWSKEEANKLTKNYEWLSEFKKDYPSQYNLFRKKGWLKDMPWLKKKINNNFYERNSNNILTEI